MSFVPFGPLTNYDREAQMRGSGLSAAGTRPVDALHNSETSTLVGREGSDKTSESPNLDLEADEARRKEGVTQLARRITEHSLRAPTQVGEYDSEKQTAAGLFAGEGLDPSADGFSYKAWAQHVLSLKHEGGIVHRTSGLAFRNLSVDGFGSALDYQKNVGNVALQAFGFVKELFGGKERKELSRIRILDDFEGLVRAGEMLVVLGPPGSGCSTFLKTISGETNGLYIDDKAYTNYQGISPKQMHKQFRGEATYTAEVDVHFPQMTVGDTLYFAARARSPRHPPVGLTAKSWAEHRRDVIMAVFGISHTLNTQVGNDFVRGVSGGERKRVTIAEVALSEAPLQCWDNSTRGLDSGNSISFCNTLRLSSDIMKTTSAVAIYQAPQAAYDYFDKVLLLYEGRQIYFGPCEEGKQYFVDLGFICPDRQTEPDFLTSMCSPQERQVREGYEHSAPRTPDEFAAAWKKSQTRTKLMAEIEQYDREFPLDGEQLETFKQSRRQQQAKRQTVKSPYTLSYGQQTRLCLWRSFRRLLGDPSVTLFQLFSNTVMSLVISSVFFNLQPNTESFYQRGGLLFFAVLLAAFSSALEILTLYAQRGIVEKQSRYCFYHPSAEAFASMAGDLPYKIVNCILSNLVLYFMSNLRREPGPFFFFLLVSFVMVLTMSMFFRTIGSASRTLTQALAPAAVVILALVIFAGFALNVQQMLGWSRWINYIDPVAYAFEALMINEFTGREFACSAFAPSGAGYENIDSANRVCTAIGSVAGQNYVSGDAYIEQAFSYSASHKWRNFGIVIAFGVFLLSTYLFFAETVSAKKSKGEVLVYKRGEAPASVKAAAKARKFDMESGEKSGANVARAATEKSLGVNHDIKVIKQTAVFSWKDIVYDIKIKGEDRRILDHVDGWVEPGRLTALMGVSGAGKTTLLDVLATRVTMGVVTGEALIDGRPRDGSFQRKTGYVQQQDLHLETSTVREALNFSALLRQPANLTDKEKLDYVDEVIKLLDMQEYADAVVGVPGEGLNVEQRKRLTIGVELAAKPQLLLFLDEPTSGLDSQTSWSILDLMEKLAKAGQSILCTIHQPSAMLFQRFDRLLFLAKGGKTVYFGEIGPSATTLTDYFARNGAKEITSAENPAEYMLRAIGAAPGSKSEVDWHQTWRTSPEYQAVQAELDRLKVQLSKQPSRVEAHEDEKAALAEFAVPFGKQLRLTLKRIAEQYWRTPSYIFSKFLLCIACSLFIGFAFFQQGTSLQQLQNQMFSIFMLFTIFNQLQQQIMPHFVTQRSLYEVRERPSKTYSWKAFMLSNIIIELPYNSLAAVAIFFCWYYPIGFYRNAEWTDSVHERGILMFLLIWSFLLFTSTLSHALIAGVPTAEGAGALGQLLFSMSLIFNGVLASYQTLPGFWKFMYRVSPFTYLFSGMVTAAVANAPVVCGAYELVTVQPPNGQTCAQYFSTFIASSGGYLTDGNATSNCQFCSTSNTNTFLASISASYSTRWRDLGIMFAYVVFNVAAALFLYWLARVPKKSNKQKLE